MIEIIFLIALTGIWLAIASFQDLKKREVMNWVSFSLVIFVLGFRFFYSLFSDSVSWNFFYQGLIGFAIFFVVGNLFYYGRVFAGGDAKLLMALGVVLGMSESFIVNLKIYVWFLILFLFVGAAYGLVWSFVLAGRNWKKFVKDFKCGIRKHLWKGILSLGFALIFVIWGFIFGMNVLVYLGILVFVFYYLIIFAKSVDEVCMIWKIKVEDLTIGDWLYKDVKIGKSKTLKADWEGLSEEEIKMLRNKLKGKKIEVRQGIPYIPVFLISYLILVSIWLFRTELMLGMFV